MQLTPLSTKWAPRKKNKKKGYNLFRTRCTWSCLEIRTHDKVTVSRLIFPLKFLLSKNLKIKMYRTIILPVVLFGCETWSLILREERRLRVFENRVLRGIFRPERDEVTREWRKLHNEELSDLYCLPNIVRVVKSRRMRWVGHVARMGVSRGVYRVLVEET